MKHFLAFDLGASSGRAIIGTLDAGKLSLKEVHRFANGPVQKGNSIYWDFPRLVNELKEGLRKALEVTPDLSGIGIDTWGVDYVFFDNKTKEAKRWPYNYRDERTSKADTDVWVKISKEAIKMGRAAQKIRLSRRLMFMAETKAKISIMGLRTAMRISIWKVICRFATSEVSRVTMEAVENLSILEKLKFCTR